MGLTKIRSKLDEYQRDRKGSQQSQSQSQSRKQSTKSTLSRKQSTDSTLSSDSNNAKHDTVRPLSDAEMLERAREAHMKVDFGSLASGPEWGGPWQRVESADQFVVFRGQAASSSKCTENGVEVMCAGELEASVEEVASILRSSSEAEHNAAMNGLYNKGFIFGSFERDVQCSENNENQDEGDDDGDDDFDLDSDEQLAVKTKSFSRTAMLGRNEQWCYFDYFQRKKDREGFMISKRALPATETTPGRIVVANAKVDQLHGLSASYLVDKLPDSKGLRVVFHAWFDQKNVPVSANNKKFLRRRSDESTCSDTSTSSDSSARSSSLDFGDSTKHKAQMRRLLALAHGVTKLPDLVRRRRFGVQVPADLGAVHVQNTRCPCCTHSLAPVKLSLSMAASTIANRSLGSLKQDTRRCFLCGYLVCVDCWSAEHMESMTGRVAAIVVCTRCRANVQACEYSEVFAGTAEQRAKHRGPPRVVEDSNDNKPTVSLLIDFLSASLLNATAGSPEHAAAMAVIRTLLRQEDSDSDFDSEDDEEEEGEDNDDEHEQGNNDEAERMATRFKELGELLGNEDKLPALDACKLGNGDQRNYPLDLPDDPTVDVPRSPIPSNEADRLAAGETSGLLQLADLLAPEKPPATTDLSVPKPDTHDLQLLCHLAVKTLGCAYSFVTVMCAKHEHVLAGTHPDFCGAAVPREQTTCQHALMSPHPFMAAHHEADIRFHKLGATSHVPIRFYVGFPLKVPLANSKPGDEELTVGMLCCIDSKPRAEITRTQYGTMKRLASTAKHFLLQKSRQLQLQQP